MLYLQSCADIVSISSPLRHLIAHNRSLVSLIKCLFFVRISGRFWCISPFNIKLSAPRTPGRGHLPPATYHLQRLLQPRFQLPPATYHLPRGSPPARALSLSWGIRESLPPPELPSSRSRLPLLASAQLSVTGTAGGSSALTPLGFTLTVTSPD